MTDANPSEHAAAGEVGDDAADLQPADTQPADARTADAQEANEASDVGDLVGDHVTSDDVEDVEDAEDAASFDALGAAAETGATERGAVIKQLRKAGPALVTPEEREALGLDPLDDEGATNAGPESEEAVAQRHHLKRVLESLVFVAEKPLTASHLAQRVQAKPSDIKPLLAELIDEYELRGIQFVEVAGGYQFRSSPATAPYVLDLIGQKPVKLTRAQLETLAIIAYRQPVTRPEIDDIRGVDSGSALKVLLERGLLKMMGRKDEAGRPMLYGTHPYFLEFFGLKSLKDLPTLREFTELSEESRDLFKRKVGEPVDTYEAEQAAAVTPDPDAEASPEDESATDLETAEAGDGLEPAGLDVERPDALHETASAEPTNSEHQESDAEADPDVEVDAEVASPDAEPEHPSL